MTKKPNPGPADATWFKSSYSSNAANCVEAAILPGAIAVRDSKDTARTPLRLSARAWNAFVAETR
ncbi:DUF397 domain-containing protein [Streptomyces sp. NPDC001054]